MTKTTHFIGIGGIGMSSLARLLIGKNHSVSGSDAAVNYITEGLEKEGARIFKGQSSTNITPHMRVIYSSDIKADNPEYQAALQLKCILMHRSDLLAELAREHRSLAVAGTHGKTTTSALLASVLVEAGLDPSFSVGGVLPQFHSNARLGQGDLFAFEADESDGTFLKYTPYGAIVTNIDNDHLVNFSGSEETLIKAFEVFLNQVSSPKHLFWCGDDDHLRKLNALGQSYGFGADCKWRVSNFRQQGFSITVDIENNGTIYKDVKVALTGQHNALNASAVFGLCMSLGVDEASIRKAFESFQGVLRRCQQKGEKHGVTFIDDYGHHPTEISATIKAIRQAVGERRLVVIFQPHRYSRTKDCLGQYRHIFDLADELVITDIFAAGESPILSVTADVILNEVRAASTIPAKYIPRSQLATVLADSSLPHDVIVTFGAGDITKLSDEVMKILARRHLKVGLVFGGRSTEHEISLRSAQHFCDSLRKDIYNIDYFGITRDGGWIVGPDAKERLERKVEQKEISSEVLQKLTDCDVLIPVLHGPYGEDGTIQGFFDILGKAYVGCDHRSAAIAMNKAFSKELVSLKGVRTSPYIDCRLPQWQQNTQSIIDAVKAKLQFPLFVKPAHLGSSIGISKVSDSLSLSKAIDEAFLYDTHVLIEQGISNCREIEFAVLGNENIQVFPPGEILTHGQVYDYKAKYAKTGFGTTASADLPPHLIEEGMALAEEAYKAIGSCGMARVDFFLDDRQQFWFNEINPIPGFTSISLYPQICAHNGLKGPELMDRLIVLALQRKRRQDRCKLCSEDSQGI